MPKVLVSLALAALCLLSFSVGPPPAVAATDWPQLGDDIPETALSTDAGKSVAISDDGSIIAVGSWENTTAGPGSVRVYECSSGSWTPKGSALTGAVNGDYFGNDIALSSDGLTLAIGAPQTSSARGQVSVYTWNSGTSSLLARLWSLDPRWKHADGFAPRRYQWCLTNTSAVSSEECAQNGQRHLQRVPNHSSPQSC